jgi:hypothetical protein
LFASKEWDIVSKTKGMVGWGLECKKMVAVKMELATDQYVMVSK